MDNITHTLIGLAAGQAATRGYAYCSKDEAKAEKLRPWFWMISALANNLPDFDFLYASFSGGKLGYLLHHRGYTHTLIAALPQGLLLLFFFHIFLHWNKKKFSHREWVWFLALAVVGPLLHVAFDFCNSYGVHPLWPFDNHWYFGDSIFIIEPWLWVALAPPLLWQAKSKVGKILLGLSIFLALGACIFTGYVPWQITLILFLFTTWYLGLMSKLNATLRVYSSLMTTLAILTIFFTASSQARAQLTTLVGLQFPETKIHDIILSPFPANPLCWSVHTVETQGDLYSLRRAVFAIAPRLIGAAECPSLPRAEGSAPLTSVRAPLRPELFWLGQFQASLTSLHELRSQNCKFGAFLRYSRAPFWAVSSDNEVLVGDLRFDRGKEMGFAKFLFEKKESSCPQNLAPWTPPRHDL